MNFRERKNLIFRMISAGLLLISLGFSIWATIEVASGISDDKILSIVATLLAAVFTLLEAVVVIKGLKKEISLYKVGFNENGKVNHVFLIATLIGTALGLALFITSLVIYVTHIGIEPYKTSTLVIMSIAIFLLINCIIYYIMLIMYKKRNLTLADYAK